MEAAQCWLTAGLIAAKHGDSVEVTLIESPDIKPIGVGEGTWPSMKATLKAIGIRETDFIIECDASFKQGSKFDNWGRAEGHSYYHPFTLPNKYHEINLAPFWQPHASQVSFTDCVCPQGVLSDHHRAPQANYNSRICIHD